jgi:hypothetical protein
MDELRREDTPRDKTGIPYAKMAEQAAVDPGAGEGVGEPFDPEAWLNELADALRGCKDLHTLDEVWGVYGQEKIESGLVGPAERRKAEGFYEAHHKRIEKHGGEAA